MAKWDPCRPNVSTRIAESYGQQPVHSIGQSLARPRPLKLFGAQLQLGTSQGISAACQRPIKPKSIQQYTHAQ
jgi:hypothetical protein